MMIFLTEALDKRRKKLNGLFSTQLTAGIVQDSSFPIIILARQFIKLQKRGNSGNLISNKTLVFIFVSGTFKYILFNFYHLKL